MILTRRDLLEMLAAAPCAGETLSKWQYDPLTKPSANAPGRKPAEAQAKKTTDPGVEHILQAIDSGRIKKRLDALAAFRTRWSLSNNADEVTRWLQLELAQAGFDERELRLQSFPFPDGSTRSNVLMGSYPPNANSIIVCAHYDSVSEIPGNSAPGVDDNASGVVAMLEAATVLRVKDTTRNLLFIAFGGEEQGLWGSRYCAELARKERWDTKLLINLDMIGYSINADRPKIILEYDQGNKTATNDAASLSFAKFIAQIFVDYTDLSLEHTDIWNSDYMPFEAIGVPCVGLYDEAADQSFYHRSNDNIDNINMRQMTSVIRGLIAALYLITTTNR